MKRTLPSDDTGRTWLLLTRLFVRRLIDNDIISPHADRHESLAVLYALIVSISMFITFFLCVDYLAAFIELPGIAALSALSDRFLFISGSMAISALAALMVWDALALEPRDAAILGPLPLAARSITRAKLAAALIFGSVITVLLNAAPSVLYPALLTVNIRGLRGGTLLQLSAVHAMTMVLAGLLGFLTILAIRGTLRLVLGIQLFQRVSSGAQSALVILTTTALLLAPTVRAGSVRAWVAHNAAPVRLVDPVLWYLGINETLAGQRLAETPIVPPPNFTRTNFPGDDEARTSYRALLPHFATLATRAWLFLPAVAAIALITFFVTNRRLPDRAADPSAASGLRTPVRRLFERYTHKDPETEAGFFFALQTLTRSAPHRTIVAVSAAVGVTHALMVLAQASQSPPSGTATGPGLLAISTGVLIPLLAGVRHAIAVPAAPAANWTIRMAWRGDGRQYLSGVKRAALALAALTLGLLLPLHIAKMGIAIALAHSTLGLLFAVAALEGLLLTCRTLPFACSYVPLENPKIAWPAALAGFLFVTYGFASAERWALQGADRVLVLASLLCAAALFLNVVHRVRRDTRRPILFDERPALPTQRLGLFDHIMGNE